MEILEYNEIMKTETLSIDQQINRTITAAMFITPQFKNDYK